MGNITIFAGGFGSGKTEIALNFAIDRAREVKGVVLADLDIINLCFPGRQNGIARKWNKINSSW